MAEVFAKHGNVEAVRYDKNGVPGAGAHHLHERDPVTGFKHLSSDEYLGNMGYPPTPATYAREAIEATPENTHPPFVGGQIEPPPGASEAPVLPEIATDPNRELRQMILEQGRQIQAMMDKMQAILEQMQAMMELLTAKLIVPPTELPVIPPGLTAEEIAAATTKAAEEAAAAAEAAAKEAAEKEAKEREDAIAAAVERVKREDEEKAVAAKKEAGEKRSAELGAAKDAVEDARNTLAGFALRRESRAGDYLTPSALIGRSQEDRRGYQEAMAAWRQAVAKYQDLGYDAMMIVYEGDEAKVASALKAELLAENNAFIELKYKLNEDRQKELTSTKDKNILGKLNAKKNQFAIWWSKQPTWKKWATGIAAGAGVGFAVSATAGVGLAALAAGAATRYSLGLISNKGSLINVSAKAKAAELKRVEKHYKSLLNLSTDHLLDQLHGQSAADFAGSQIGKETRHHMNKNRLGRAIMLGGAALTALGLLGVDYIPGYFGWPGGSQSQTSGGSGSPSGPEITAGGGGLDFSHFKPNQFGGPGLGPHDSVKSMFGVLHQNGIEPRGLTDAKIDQIIQDMRAQHMNVAFGMDNLGNQHLVDAAQGYSGTTTPNEFASGLQGLEKVGKSSVANWEKFAKIVQDRGVELTQNARG